VDIHSQRNRLLLYKQHYETFLDRHLRTPGRDRDLTYCLGFWLNSAQSAKVQEIFRQKRAATFFVTHFLALTLFAFALAFYFAFAWYFFP
jgi:hypothetical protein